jgi:hypothetical protein
MIELLEIQLGKIEERKEGDSVILRFPFARAEFPNLNRRVYPKAVLSKAVDEVQRKIKSGQSIYGAPSHPEGQLELDQVSHLLTKVEMVGVTAYAEAKVLPTSRGKNLQVILKHGGSLGISARGFGSVKKEKREMDDGKEVELEVVQPDYTLAAVDFVTSPSFELYAGQANMVESLREELREGLRGNVFSSQPLLNEEKILEQQYRVAQITGYKLSFEDFKASKTDDKLAERFDFAVRAGYKKSFADFRKIGR